MVTLLLGYRVEARISIIIFIQNRHFSKLMISDFSPNLLLRYNRPNRLQIVELLVKSGADVNLGYAKGVSPLSLLTKEGIDNLSNGKWLSKVADSESDDCPIRRKVENSVPIIKYLLACGANPNIFDRQRNTPLLQAALFGIKDAVESLLEHGADVRHVGPDGLTALHISCMTQSEKNLH